MRKNNIRLTHSRLLQALHYDYKTGHFIWLEDRKKVKSGQIAGSPTNQGYIRIMIDQERFLAHRLAWFYVNKVWPEEQIDHINLNQSDNRYCNLREATQSQNQANRGMQKNNTTGFKGVSYNKKTKRFMARVKVNGMNKHLGCFMTAEEAHYAYKSEFQKMNGDFARTS